MPKQALGRIQVQHVGPVEGGGIATVLVSLVRALQVYSDLDVRPVPSTVAGGKPQKLIAAGRAGRRLWRPGPSGPRIVHFHLASGPSFWRKAWLHRVARAAGASSYLHVHGGGFMEFLERAPRAATGFIDETFHSARRVLAISRAQQLALATRFRRSVELLPNAVEIPPLTSPPLEPPVRWIHIGRLGVMKGTWDLLQALQLLDAEDLPPWEALLVGDGDAAEARHRAESFGGKVRVLGWQSADEIASLVRASHALVLPSYLEGMPMGLLEAMSSGRPVISTTVGGIPELVEHGVEGLLVAPGDIAGLADALRRLLVDDGLRAALGAAARAKVERDHRIETAAEKLHEMYLNA